MLFRAKHGQLFRALLFSKWPKPLIYNSALGQQMRKFKKNTNQTDLLELLAQLEQLEQVSDELNWTSALGPLELNLGDAEISEPEPPMWIQASIDSLIELDDPTYVARH